jgi:hypothetical protein
MAYTHNAQLTGRVLPAVRGGEPTGLRHNLDARTSLCRVVRPRPNRDRCPGTPEAARPPSHAAVFPPKIFSFMLATTCLVCASDRCA